MELQLNAVLFIMSMMLVEHVPDFVLTLLVLTIIVQLGTQGIAHKIVV